MIDLFRALLSVAYSLLILAIIALFFVRNEASLVADVVAILVVVLLITIVILVIRKVLRTSAEHMYR